MGRESCPNESQGTLIHDLALRADLVLAADESYLLMYVCNITGGQYDGHHAFNDYSASILNAFCNVYAKTRQFDTYQVIWPVSLSPIFNLYRTVMFRR